MADQKERVTKTDSTEVVTKKTTQKLWQKVFTFDPKEIQTNLIDRILIPGAMNLISNALKSTIDGIFHTSGGSYYNGGTQQQGASYQSYYANSGTVPKNQTKVMNAINENIWVREEARARDIVTDIKMTIMHNGFATVGQLYDRAGLTVPYTAEYWGWTNFSASIVPGKNNNGEDGWVIVTPPAMEIHR